MYFVVSPGAGPAGAGGGPPGAAAGGWDGRHGAAGRGGPAGLPGQLDQGQGGGGAGRGVAGGRRDQGGIWVMPLSAAAPLLQLQPGERDGHALQGGASVD